MSSHNQTPYKTPHNTPDVTFIPSPNTPDPSPPPEVVAYLSHTLPPDPGDAFFSDIAQRALAQANAQAQAHADSPPAPSHLAYRPRLLAIAASFLLSSALLWYLLSSTGAPPPTYPHAPDAPTTIAATHTPPDATPSPLSDDPTELTESIDSLSANQLSALSARLPSLRAPLPLTTEDDDLGDLGDLDDDLGDLYALDGLDEQALSTLQASLQTTYKLDTQHR